MALPRQGRKNLVWWVNSLVICVVMSTPLTVTIKLFAIYQEAYGETEIQRTFPAGTAIAAVLGQILQEKPQLAPWQSVTRFGRNQQFVTENTLHQDGDEIVLIPPVSGG